MSAPAITQASKLEDFPKNPTVHDYFKAAIGDKVEDILARMEVPKILAYYKSVINNIKKNPDLKNKKSLSEEDHQKIIGELKRLFGASGSEIDKFNKFASRVRPNKDAPKNLDKILAGVMEVKEKEYTSEECFVEAFKDTKDGPFDHEAGQLRILKAYMLDIVSVFKKELDIEKIVGQDNHDFVIARLQYLYGELGSSVDELNKFAIFLRWPAKNKKKFSLDRLIGEFGKAKEGEMEEKYCAKDCFVAAFEGVENGRHDDKIEEDKVYATSIIKAIKAKLNIKKEYIGSEEYPLIVKELKSLYGALGSDFDKLVRFGCEVKLNPRLAKSAEEYDSCVKKVAESSWEERYPAHKYFSEAFGGGKVEVEDRSITITEGDIHSIKLNAPYHTMLISKIKAELSISGDGYNERIGKELINIRMRCETLEGFKEYCKNVHRQHMAERTKKPPLSSEDPLPPEKKAKRARSGRPKAVFPTALSAPISNGQSHLPAGLDSLEVAPSDNPCPSAPSPNPSFAGELNDDLENVDLDYFDNVDFSDFGSLFDYKEGLTTCPPIESPSASDDDGKRSSPSSSVSAEECERLARRARTGAYSPSLDY